MFISFAGVSIAAADTPTTTLTLSGISLQLTLSIMATYGVPDNFRSDDSGAELDELEVELLSQLLEQALAELTP